jgi:hypothetical protein
MCTTIWYSSGDKPLLQILVANNEIFQITQLFGITSLLGLINSVQGLQIRVYEVVFNVISENALLLFYSSTKLYREFVFTSP